MADALEILKAHAYGNDFLVMLATRALSAGRGSPLIRGRESADAGRAS
jgi:hypothetical protein